MILFNKKLTIKLYNALDIDGFENYMMGLGYKKILHSKIF